MPVYQNEHDLRADLKKLKVGESVKLEPLSFTSKSCVPVSSRRRAQVTTCSSTRATVNVVVGETSTRWWRTGCSLFGTGTCPRRLAGGGKCPSAARSS